MAGVVVGSVGALATVPILNCASDDFALALLPCCAVNDAEPSVPHMGAMRHNNSAPRAGTKLPMVEPGK